MQAWTAYGATVIFTNVNNFKKMQLDVDVSPPAISLLVDMNPTVMNFFLVLEFFSSDFWSSPRQTDGQTDRPKATPKSPPCMSTGGLKYDM